MKSVLVHKKIIGIVFLFFFLFSANALLFSTHFVEEFGHDDHSMTSHSDDDNVSTSAAQLVVNHEHDGDQGAHHEDGETCCDGHSHALNSYEPICYRYTPQLTTRIFTEPFKAIPEVFLDKFIPPQNFA